MTRVAICVVFLTSLAFAQTTVVDLPRAPLGDGPWVFDTAEQNGIKVTVMTKSLQRPFGLAFLPDGTILVTERPGRLRVVRDGVLDPQPVTGLPAVNTRANAGLFDVVPHPEFAENRLIYFAFSKAGQDDDSATVLASARFDGRALADVKELYATDWGKSLGGTRIVFAPDGTLYMDRPGGDRGESGGPGPSIRVRQGAALERQRDDSSG